MTNTELLSHLQQLEGRISRLRMALMAVASVLLICFIAAGAAPQKSNTIRATKFELIDDSGKVLAAWQSEKIGSEDSTTHPTLRFNSARGRIIVGKCVELSDNGVVAGVFIRSPVSTKEEPANAVELSVSSPENVGRAYWTRLNLKGQLGDSIDLEIHADPTISAWGKKNDGTGEFEKTWLYPR